MRVRSLVAPFSILLNIPLLFLITSSASAQTINVGNMLRGKVRTAEGVSVNNAMVELRSAGGAVIGQTVTRTDGDFTFTGLNAGEYEVVVSSSGYQTTFERAEFTNMARVPIGEIIHLEIRLRPEPQRTLAPPGSTFAQDIPKPARAAYVKAVAELQKGKSDEGISLLKEAIASYNEYFDAHLTLARELYRVGKDAESLQALENARLINDRDGALYYSFGLLMVRQQKFGAAEYAFGKAVEFSPDNVLARFNHAVALIEVGVRLPGPADKSSHFLAANKELDQAWTLSGKKLNNVMLHRARINESLGRKEEAARILESYLKAEPKAPNAEVIRQNILRLRTETASSK